MLVLHGLGTAAGEVALWAEDSALPATVSGPLPGAAVAHPFAVEDLSHLVPGGRAEVVPLLLPSTGDGPLASPELVRDPLAEPAPPTGVRLEPWLVPAVVLSPGAAAEVLAGLTEAQVRLGSSPHYLRQVTAFAADLADRGRVLPGLVTGVGGLRARWRPALSGVDSARFAKLAAAMPPICRAQPVRPEDTDGRPAAEVLRSLLNALTDHEVRDRLDGLQLATGSGAVESWLGALTGEPGFEADRHEARELRDRIDAWHASAAHDAAVRLGFRLLSPEQNEKEDWRLEFLLQAVEDPSVLIPASQVWRSGQHDVLSRWIHRPQELLLTELGRASRLFRRLDDALAEAHPAGLDLDAEGAYDFLTQAPALDEAGYGVLLPKEWRRPGDVALRLETRSKSATGVVTKDRPLDLKQLVDYRWELSVGGQRLSEAELASLAAAKVPLVRLRGQWTRIDQRGLAAGLAFLNTSRRGEMSVSQAIRHLGASPAPLPVAEVTGDGRFGELLEGKAGRFVERIDTPPGFHGTLRPYQLRGLAWLAFLDELGLGACLADDMGLGKTVQLLALEALCRKDGPRPPTLLVCPMTVVGNWQREAARFTPDLRVHVHHGIDRGPVRAAEADLVITTYALAARDAESLSEVDWDRVVLDEAQNVKNSASQQAKAVRGFTARHRVALTGTPVENRLAELWSIMDFLNPGFLDTANTFHARFSVPIERHGDHEAAARLRRATGPFVLRRLKTDPVVIDDLPERLEFKQLCTLTAEQVTLYRAVVDDMLDQIAQAEQIKRKGLVLATMSKLKQVCNHPAHFFGDGSELAGRSGKLARLEEVLEEVLAEGDKALCFTQFARFGAMLVPYLSERFDTEVLFLHGGTSQPERDRLVERFQSPGGPSLFLLSLKAGGTGLNLTAANHVVHIDRWWNPAVEDQATDRAFRIGQRRDVQVRKFACAGTLEEKIDRILTEKASLARLVVGAGEHWLTELSTESLRELLTLEAP
ncbi:DEAD/DEAH box helicase [Amycolatopsis albispora]|uniref:Helicase SNF2 n=1 Tax=Amycolatopsis albispora TaxID=1804986 RepID=A0A344L7F1_9PSEU|nr:DEAD/DEAH box helicase [Amycolatopsis albispora]AXB43975.1 helicase SNF2 [Amycolatopsis albispora]